MIATRVFAVESGDVIVVQWFDQTLQEKPFDSIGEVRREPLFHRKVKASLAPVNDAARYVFRRDPFQNPFSLWLKRELIRCSASGASHGGRMPW